MNDLSNIKQLTAEEILKLLDADNLPNVNVWLARGDGIAVYENHDLGSQHRGHRKFISFGSEVAMALTPPPRLPDMFGAINWAYQLVGTYRGDVLVLKPDTITRYDVQVLNSKRQIQTSFRLSPNTGAPTATELQALLRTRNLQAKRGWSYQYWVVRAGDGDQPPEGPITFSF